MRISRVVSQSDFDELFGGFEGWWVLLEGKARLEVGVIRGRGHRPRMDHLAIDHMQRSIRGHTRRASNKPENRQHETKAGLAARYFGDSPHPLGVPTLTRHVESRARPGRGGLVSP